MLENASPAGIRVNTIVLAFTLVAGTIVFLRLFTRLVLTKGAGFEDVCIAFAMVSSIGLAVVTSEQVMHGLGQHMYELDADDITITLKMFWAIITCGTWGIVGNVFICKPISYFWDESFRGGRCMNEYIIWFTTAGLNIGQDVIILFLPLPVIRSLQISRSQKKGLITMLALGASVIVVSTIRLYTLDDLANSNDRTFDNTDQATLSAVEVNVGIVCACLPAMRPLFALMMPKYFTSAPAYTTVPANDLERRLVHMRAKSVSPGIKTPTQTFRPGSKYSRVSGSQVTLATPPYVSSRSSTHTASRGASMAQSRSASIFQPRSGSVSHSRNGSATHSRNPSATHSRNGSTLSVTVPKGITAGPFQGKALNPLRMSPVTPFAPPIALRLGSVSEDNFDDTATLAPSVYSRRPSEASISLTRLPTSKRAPRTPVSTKPLPLTPFPVTTSGEWSHLTAIPRPKASEKTLVERIEVVKTDEA
ncbi:hypothetical protein E8E13_009437 [Curvularia kusanoi]|uniref:Rhodopsin domain-containing protein n=1 Tax=Curvularia kusanoi TaxID=90978 RepID=A0A9P4WDZ2_CURKU|nr:hypothetical protein E8E13_009437 [Curvularia kusanoi]